MNQHETEALQDFLHHLAQAGGVAKDPQADAMIAQAVAREADAPYLLVQRALLQDQALNAAKAQIASLERQLQAAQAPQRPFLDPNAWGNTGVSRPLGAQVAPPVSRAQAPWQYAAQAAGGGFFGGGLGSTLGTV
jgi:hypothetical protein